METYLIITSISTTVIGICQVLKLGKLLSLWQYKRLYPNSSLDEVRKCEESYKKKNYYFPIFKKEK